jgi:hypothetical protein
MMNNNKLEDLEHVRQHTQNPDIDSEEKAVEVLLEIFESEDEHTLEVRECPLCQNFLGVSLFHKDSKIHDYEKAYDLLLKASQSGLLKAQANLGIFICKGLLHGVDYRAARYWFNKAAEQGDEIAIRKLAAIKEVAPELLPDQGHGDHNEAVTDSSIMEMISTTLNEGECPGLVKTFVNDEHDDCPNIREVFSLEHYSDDIMLRALVVASDEATDFVSLYPVIADGAYYEVEIDTIYEWENGIEATIYGYIEDFPIGFFMADYFLYKTDIVKGKRFGFKLGMIAYDCEEVIEKSFQFEGQQAIDYLTKIGDKPKYDTQGNVEPVVFNLENLAAFLQTNSKYPDNVSFQSPIQHCNETESLGTSFYKFRIIAHHHPDITLPLYVKKSLVNFQPQASMSIRGVGWVQGCLVH